MVPDGWLVPSLAILGLTAANVEDLVRPVAERIAMAARLDASRVESAFLEAMQGEGFSIGRGVAIPHIELSSLQETFVCLVTLREALPLQTIDGRAPDVFLFILAKSDPQAHLLLLAHLARLTRSRTLLDGLRRASTVDEMMALVSAAEMRHPYTRSPEAPAVAGFQATQALIVVSVSGEKLVDTLLIELVEQGFEDACVLEAQSLREAAAREVPLFAGFRELFGDPGGRRVLIMEAAAERVDAVLGTLERVASEHHAIDARASVIPILTRWFTPQSDRERTKPSSSR